MRIGSGQVLLSLPESFSLKDKRRIMNSIKQRLRNRFNLSVIELNPDVAWNQGFIGFACVGEDEMTVRHLIDQIGRFVEDDGRYEIIQFTIQIY
ncbi:MAG TPA: DUF503 domain-containing protein [Atribacter sp.]|jgi:uncharacterized protein YlxP (DUF503 family)|uniref:DUF503 domain-containing protein n=1 Tax=Candidatus Atribacter allofermentans TaxID=1852833 RepID=A0A1V5T3F2_9BACT|nr:DUF503 domain-containing protein [Atribacter sp.]MDD3713263.1 DUF503 domain-containing protein [Atribacterota bacterium]OQA61289.1 MAG: hypothetical protein BWY41_00240 [Candidatus Atribacteria bacterium ADurb.Bin276]HHT11328.1 DUF503 domain-containing protein [Candidatus Atribacteria bacterium]MDI9595782.1 DUF503 domain-containing protein [Atribacterota bacterium]HOT04802.1 DUF503 domain-containing protein [Atribacter sp.]